MKSEDEGWRRREIKIRRTKEEKPRKECNRDDPKKVGLLLLFVNVIVIMMNMIAVVVYRQ